MKELKLVILFLLLTMILQGFEEPKKEYTSRVFGTLDIDGAIVSQNSLEMNKSFGFQIFAEKFYRYSESFEVSYGLGIQMNENIKTLNAYIPTYYSTPVYAALKYNIFGEAIYLKGKIGVPITEGLNLAKKLNRENNLEEAQLENKNPIFWGLSIGLDYGIYEWEMTYTINSIDYTYEKGDERVRDNVENIRVALGYSKKI